MSWTSSVPLAADPGQDPDLLHSIGDDCAVIKAGPDRVWLVSTDCLVQDTHFGPWHPPELLGRKAVSVNVSDIAAMGGTPRFLLLGLCLPEDLPADWFPLFHQGLRAACADYACLLIGGDTVQGREINLSLTVIGQARAKEVILRSGACPGDTVWCSAPLGEAAAGLELCRRGLDTERDPLLERCCRAHLDPQAQVEHGRRLAVSGQVRAMMDMSDGLATDLAHKSQASCGREKF